MPATSRAQFRFMQAVAHGSIKRPGLSPEKAAEDVAGESPKGLPERQPEGRAARDRGGRRGRAGWDHLKWSAARPSRILESDGYRMTSVIGICSVRTRTRLATPSEE